MRYGNKRHSGWSMAYATGTAHRVLRLDGAIPAHQRPDTIMWYILKRPARNEGEPETGAKLRRHGG